jgi:hypothetical protein
MTSSQRMPAAYACMTVHQHDMYQHTLAVCILICAYTAIIGSQRMLAAQPVEDNMCSYEHM